MLLVQDPGHWDLQGVLLVATCSIQTRPRQEPPPQHFTWYYGIHLWPLIAVKLEVFCRLPPGQGFHYPMHVASMCPCLFMDPGQDDFRMVLAEMGLRLSCSLYMYMYIYTYTYVHLYVYIYIERESERERERWTHR